MTFPDVRRPGFGDLGNETGGAGLRSSGQAMPRVLEVPETDRLGIPLRSKSRTLEARFASESMPRGELETATRLFENGGLDGEIDLLEAALWYRRSAEAGSGRAAHRLGWMFLRGETFAESSEAAEHGFRESMRLGHAPGPAAGASFSQLRLRSVAGLPFDRAQR
ncbi:MAG: hypothetical protein ACK4IT_10965 [Thioalkalivibrionaceae bacterium]